MRELLSQIYKAYVRMGKTEERRLTSWCQEVPFDAASVLIILKGISSDQGGSDDYWPVALFISTFLNDLVKVFHGLFIYYFLDSLSNRLGQVCCKSHTPNTNGNKVLTGLK